MQVVQAVMRILRAGLPYFLLLIGVGFALGILRLLLITPHDTYGLDDHIPAANLLQAPAMFLVTLVAARKIAASSSLPASPANLRRVGFISLVCVVTAEFSVVLWFQGHPITSYFVG